MCIVCLIKQEQKLTPKTAALLAVWQAATVNLVDSTHTMDIQSSMNAISQLEGLMSDRAQETSEVMIAQCGGVEQIGKDVDEADRQFRQSRH